MYMHHHTSAPGYTAEIPVAQWLFVQAWLTQNYMLPVTEYLVYPGFPLCTVAFYRESDYTHFIQRWQHIIDPGTSEEF